MGFDVLQDFDAGNSIQRNIENDDVGFYLCDGLDGFLSIGHLAADSHVLFLVNDLGDATPEHRMIIDD
jgi:hypothetical protein